MLSPYNKLISALIGITLAFFLILLHSSSQANDLTITVTTSAGGTLNTLQDGQDNNIDFDIESMNGFIMPRNKTVLDYKVHRCSQIHRCFMCSGMINFIENHFQVLTGEFQYLYFCEECRDH